MMETLSTYMQPFFDWLLRSTFQASIVVCLILLIQGALRSRLTARWHYALWLILVVRMVLPWAPQSRFSIFNFTTWQSKPKVSTNVVSQLDVESTGSVRESSATQKTTLGQERSINEDETAVAAASDVSSSPLGTRPELTGSGERQDRTLTASTGTPRESADPATRLPFRLSGVLPLLWLTGAILLGGYIIICNLKLWRAASIECPSTDKEILELLEECRSEIGLRIIVTLVPSKKASTPILLGFVRPRLLIPENITKELTREELRYVFLHELAHVKRHDIALGWLTALLQALHWFNPLVWLAFHRMRSNRELACDALVLSRMQDEGTQDYGRAIVSLLENFSVPQALPGLAGILESKSQLKRRITMITQFSKNSYQWAPLPVVLIMSLAFVCLADATGTRAAGVSAVKPIGGMTLRRVMACDTDQPPRVSPDGRYFCDVRWEGKIKVLSVRELAVGRETVIASSNDTCDINWKLVISPNSKMVAYNWTDHDRNITELRIASLDGSEHRVLCSSKFHTVLEDWSDDGVQILGLRPPTDWDGETFPFEREIVWVSTKDGSVKTITTLPKERGVFGYGGMVDLSPDGRCIAYHAREREVGLAKYSIFVFDIDKRRETVLEHPGSNKLVGWAPDGKHILFTSVHMGTRGLWLQQVADGKPEGEPKLIRSNIDEFSPVGLTRSGSCYYISSFRLDTLSTATLDLRTGRVLSSPQPLFQNADNTYMCVTWSPDGKYLTYCQKGSGGSSNIHIRSLAGGVERIIDTDLPMVGWICWTPSGQSLIASWLCPGDGGSTATDLMWSVHQINVETGNRNVFFKSDFGRPIRTEFSTDGKSLVYNAGNSLLVRDMDTGKERKIFEFGENGWHFWWDLAPNGRSVVVGAPGPDSWPTYLKVISLEGSELRELLPQNWGGIYDVVWAPDGKSIIFTSQESLWQIPAEGGEPRKILTSAGLGDLSRSSISLHPDGQHIAFTASKYSEELWVMEDFLP